MYTIMIVCADFELYAAEYCLDITLTILYNSGQKSCKNWNVSYMVKGGVCGQLHLQYIVKCKYEKACRHTHLILT